MNGDGTDAHALITSVVVEGRPAWFPDGTMLAFTGFEPGPSVVVPDIWTVIQPLTDTGDACLVELYEFLDRQEQLVYDERTPSQS